MSSILVSFVVILLLLNFMLFLYCARVLDNYANSEDLIKKISDLKRKIEIKDSYCRVIQIIGYDADDCNDVDGCKDIIDELVELSDKALKNDDESIMFVDDENNTVKNILMEEIK